MAGFLLSTAVVRPSSVVAQNRAFKSGVEVVPLAVTVTDRAGRYVPDLTAADFDVFEEGKRQVVSHFATDRVPVTYVNEEISGFRRIPNHSDDLGYGNSLLQPCDNLAP